MPSHPLAPNSRGLLDKSILQKDPIESKAEIVGIVDLNSTEILAGGKNNIILRRPGEARSCAARNPRPA